VTASRIFLWAALLALAGLATSANAERSEPERPKFENLPFEEDWSVLRDRNERELLDPIKYIPFDDAGRFWLSGGGQLRGRIELWSNYQYGQSTPDVDDSYFLTRIRFHTDLHLTQYFRVFAEFKSALSTRRTLTGGRRNTDVDTADLQNAFAELKLPLAEVDLGIVGGRRELQFGAQRLVSPLDWANVRRTFLLGMAYARGETWDASGFWSQPVVVDKHDFNERDKDTQFYGIYTNFDLPKHGTSVNSLGLDVYWLALQFETARASNGSQGPGTRHTIGGRLFGDIPATPLNFDLEAAAQVGNVGIDDILAGMVSAKATWPFSDTLFSPAVYLGYDWASGDSGAGGKVGTFDQLYPLGHAYLGLIDSVARQNIHSVQSGVRIKPFEKALLEMTWLAFWLEDVNDALYDAGGSVIRLDPTASSSFVGGEVDITFKYPLFRGIDTLVGYSHFFAGQFLSDSGPDDDVDFGYLQIQYTF
jgi:hypothetical protein